MNIYIPELNTLSSLQFASEINSKDYSNVDEVIFIADMKWVRPFGMLIAATAMKNLRRQYPDVSFKLQCDINKKGVSYAAYMGFFKSISESIAIGNSPGEASGNDNYLPITHLDINELQNLTVASGRIQEIGDTIEQKAAELAKIICRSNLEMQALMTYLIREILRNIPEHAESNKAWICGQFWSDNTAEIAIVDEGIGIKRSLRKNLIHREYINDDLTALQYSIKAGISKAFNPRIGNKSYDVWSNSGYGLYMVSEICKELDGSFCISSGNNYLYIANDGTQTGQTNMCGTAVKMTFSTSNLIESKRIIQKIAGQGEAEAQTVKNAFKKASHPSKGLILEL